MGCCATRKYTVTYRPKEDYIDKLISNFLNVRKSIIIYRTAMLRGVGNETRAVGNEIDVSEMRML